MKRLFLIVFVMLIPTWQATLSAQTHEHSSITAPTIIDGSINPELIPDNSAYRLWFSTVALPDNPTELQLAVNRSQLAQLDLNQVDYEALTAVLKIFNRRFNELLLQDEQEVKASAQLLRIHDESKFLQERDAMVEGMIDSLKSQLSASAMKRVDGHIQEEKRHMQLSSATR